MENTCDGETEVEVEVEEEKGTLPPRPREKATQNTHWAPHARSGAKRGRALPLASDGKDDDGGGGERSMCDLVSHCGDFASHCDDFASHCEELRRFPLHWRDQRKPR